jgi:hypothetical protein
MQIDDKDWLNVNLEILHKGLNSLSYALEEERHIIASRMVAMFQADVNKIIKFINVCKIEHCPLELEEHKEND